jgi:hypothetical protein
MTEELPSRGARVLAGGAAIALVGLLLLGIVWYGFAWDVHQRIWRDIADRVGGPMSFRFLLQPTMAAIAALHDGIKDAQLGRDPYFWTVLNDPTQRSARLREGLRSTARIILLGLAMDVIYQHRVLGTFYPGEAVLITLLLAVVPYFLLRGSFARLARWWRARSRQRSMADTGN